MAEPLTRVTGFFVTVIQAGRQHFLMGMIDYFLDAVRKYQHIGIADVTSACALSDAQNGRPLKNGFWRQRVMSPLRLIIR